MTLMLERPRKELLCLEHAYKKLRLVSKRFYSHFGKKKKRKVNLNFFLGSPVELL